VLVGAGTDVCLVRLHQNIFNVAGSRIVDQDEFRPGHARRIAGLVLFKCRRVNAGMLSTLILVKIPSPLTHPSQLETSGLESDMS